jgi:hypothetical protein
MDGKGKAFWYVLVAGLVAALALATGSAATVCPNWESTATLLQLTRLEPGDVSERREDPDAPWRAAAADLA